MDLNEFLKLKPLEELRSLTVHGNPLVRIPNFRLYLIEIFPNLKKLDTVLISIKERDNSQTWVYQFKYKKLPVYLGNDFKKPEEPQSKKEDKDEVDV